MKTVPIQALRIQAVDLMQDLMLPLAEMEVVGAETAAVLSNPSLSFFNKYCIVPHGSEVTLTYPSPTFQENPMDRKALEHFQAQVEALMNEMHSRGLFREAAAGVAYALQAQLTYHDRKNVVNNSGALENIMRGVGAGIETDSGDRYHMLTKIEQGFRTLQPATDE